mgnify:CR=1 FL=1
MDLLKACDSPGCKTTLRERGQELIITLHLLMKADACNFHIVLKIDMHL